MRDRQCHAALSNATNKMRLKHPEYGECLELKNQMIGWSDAFYVHSRDVNSVSMMFEEMYSELVFRDGSSCCIELFECQDYSIL